MRLALIRSDPRFSAERQEAVLSARRRYTDREALLKALRVGDELEVSDFHRLATGMADFRDAWTALGEKRVVVIEMRTGDRSDSQKQFSAMLYRATQFWAGRDPDTMAERGRAGAEKSSATKPKLGRMPPREAMRFLNDHEKYPRLEDALRAINSDRKYRTPWTKSFVYRQNKNRAVSLRPRLSGYARNLETRQ